MRKKVLSNCCRHIGSTFWFLLFTGGAIAAQAKEIAITFDDSPRSATGYFDGPTRAQRLIDELRQHDVPTVAFFSVSEPLDEEGIDRLNTYSNAGHLIANHTHSHPNFNQLSLREFSEDALSAHEKLKQFPTFVRWFRFPFLREGDSLEKRDGMRELLRKHGYRNAYITLNNYDWYIEYLFQQALRQGRTVDLEKMRDFYVSVLMESIESYDEMAVMHLGRSPKHVLLLHEMDISALFIGDLVDELRRQGWTIISPQSAYQDDIASYQSANLFKFNPGRIGEIAKDQGQIKGLWPESLDEGYLKRQFEERVLMQDAE